MTSLAFDRLNPSDRRELTAGCCRRQPPGSGSYTALLAFAGKSRLVIEDIDVPALITELVPTG